MSATLSLERVCVAEHERHELLRSRPGASGSTESRFRCVLPAANEGLPLEKLGSRRGDHEKGHAVGVT